MTTVTVRGRTFTICHDAQHRWLEGDPADIRAAFGHGGRVHSWRKEYEDVIYATGSHDRQAPAPVQQGAAGRDEPERAQTPLAQGGAGRQARQMELSI